MPSEEPVVSPAIALPEQEKVSPWLKTVYETARTLDLAEAIDDVQNLLRLLRKHAKISPKKREAAPVLSGVEWRHLGDFHRFPGTVNRRTIVLSGQRQGWVISVVKSKKTDEWQAMAIRRLGATG